MFTNIFICSSYFIKFNKKYIKWLENKEQDYMVYMFLITEVFDFAVRPSSLCLCERKHSQNSVPCGDKVVGVLGQTRHPRSEWAAGTEGKSRDQVLKL